MRARVAAAGGLNRSSQRAHRCVLDQVSGTCPSNFKVLLHEIILSLKKGEKNLCFIYKVYCVICEVL